VTFHVDISSLRGLPPFLDRRDREFHAALTYLMSGAVIHDVAPLYHPMVARHQANVRAVARLLTDAATYVSTDATRVRSVADTYALADRRAELRNLGVEDAVLPDFPTGFASSLAPTVQPSTPALFADHTAPVARLGPIADSSTYLPFQPAWAHHVGAAGLIRDGIWIGTRIAAASGLLDHAYDPVKVLVTPFVGDWPGLLRSADALANIAAFLRDESTSVDAARRAVPTVWTGHASDACQCSLGNFASALAAAATDLATLAAAYRDVGRLLHSIMETAGDTFGTIVDCALDILGDGLTDGLLIPLTVPGTVVEFADALTAFIGLAHDVGRVVEHGFPPGDPLGPLLGLVPGSTSEGDRRLVLPDLAAIAGHAEIPSLAAPVAPPTTVRTRQAV
jgi:hypothetical protein